MRAHQVPLKQWDGSHSFTYYTVFTIKTAHTYEGPDDMPSHIKMALTRTAEVIPFVDGCLCLGTWQGVFLWEHRTRSHSRRIVLSYQGE
jgi:secondary thiamine-phosphate synthase enzyme